MNNLLVKSVIFFLFFISSNILSGQQVVVGKKQQMYAANNTSYTYLFTVKYKGKIIAQQHLKPGTSMPIGYKAKPKYFNRMSLELEYDFFSYDVDREARYKYFRNKGLKEGAWLSIGIAVADYLTGGKISPELLGLVKTFTEDEMSKFDKDFRKEVERQEEKFNKSITKEEKDKIRAAIIVAIINLREARKTINDAEKKSKASQYMIGKIYNYNLADFLTKKKVYPIHLDIGAPLIVNYIYRSSEMLSYDKINGSVIPYHFQLAYKTDKLKGKGYFYTAGVAASRSPLVFRDTADLNFTNNSGYSFSHFDAFLGADARTNRGKGFFGLGFLLGLRTSFSKKYQYASAESKIEITNEESMEYEDTQILFGVNAHLAHKNFVVFAKYQTTSDVKDWSDTIVKVEGSHFFVGVSFPILKYNYYK